MPNIGEVLKGAHSQYELIKEISRGGQGIVYKAKDHNNNAVAIKWYFINDPGHSQNIYNLFTRRKPPALNSSASSNKYIFVWPDDFIRANESFGYRMQLLDLSSSISCGDIIFTAQPLEYEVLVNASKNLISAFEALHNSGYCYKDISHGNIFINTKTGFVSIIDVDNITTPNNKSGQAIIGTEGYIAPEIVRGTSMPDTQTDRFSVAVLLFYLWVRNNPFEGPKHAECMPNDFMGKWGNPVFIFHPTDKCNSAEADPKYAPNQYALARAYWSVVPPVLKKLFIQAFTDGLDRSRRVIEYRWNEAFREVEASFVKCKCGKTGIGGMQCLFCGKQLPDVVKPPQGVDPPKPPTPPTPPTPQPQTAPQPTKPRIIVYRAGSTVSTYDIKEGLEISGKEFGLNFPVILSITAKPGEPNTLMLNNKTYYNWKLTTSDNSPQGQLMGSMSMKLDNVVQLECLGLIIKIMK